MSTPSRTVRQARHDLAASVRRLVDPVVQRRLSTGGVIERRAPSLLDQLREAVACSGGRGGNGRAAAPIPIAADAHDLLTEIEHYAAVELWRQEPGVAYVGTTVADRVPVPPVPCAERIRRCARFVAARSAAPEDLDWLTVLLGGWAHRIAAMLDPAERTRAIRRATCPACGLLDVETVVDLDVVRAPALQVHPDGTADCRACGAQWASVLALAAATEAAAQACAQ